MGPTFFYVWDNTTEDLIRLHPYAPGPPNPDLWDKVPKKPTVLANQVNKRFQELKDLGLHKEDAMIMFVRNRISPSRNTRTKFVI